jgi:hypothetical protein
VLATIPSAVLLGVDGRPVTVEVHVSNGLPGFTIVGQPDASCREARDRVRAALLSSGLAWPLKRVTVDLSETHGTLDRVSEERWHDLAEALLGQVEQLLNEREDLLCRLEAAAGDLDIAKERIRQLEGLKDALEVELLRTKKKAHKGRVGAIAFVIGLILPNVVSGVSEGLASEYASKARDTAAAVVSECKVTVNLPPDEAPDATASPTARAAGAAGSAGSASVRTESRVVSDSARVTDSATARVVPVGPATQNDTANPTSPSGPFVKTFDESDWRPGGEDASFVITVPAAEHGRGETPSIAVQRRREDGSFEDIGVEIHTLADGTVRIGAAMTFAGRIILR